MEISDSPSLKIIGDLTIIFWVYPTNISKGRQNPIGKAFGGEFDLTMEPENSLSYYHGSSGGNDFPYMGCGGTVNMFSNNNWIFVGITRKNDSQRISFYINGIPVYSGCGSWVNPSISTRRVGIGYEYADYFQGFIDEVRLYNRALSDAEIQVIYNATK